MNGDTAMPPTLRDLNGQAAPPVGRGFALSAWLRVLGALSFVAAAASFLVEGWTDPGILKRQLLWALGTVVMSACGVIAIRRFRDATSARVFLCLAAATIPAHFAQVGASLWALRSEDNGSSAEVLAAAATLLLLAPALALGISALVRRHARLLVALVFVTGGPLLIPTRDGDWIALLGVLEIALCLGMEATIFRRDVLFRTIEGSAARILLLVPCAILLVRNAFYAETPLWRAALLFVPSIVLLVLPRIWMKTTRLARAAQIAGTLGVACALSITLAGGPVLALLLSGVALVAGELITNPPKPLIYGSALLFAAAGLLFFIEPPGWTLLLAAPIAGLHVAAAYRRRSLHRTVTVLGISVVSGLAHAARLVSLPTHDVWVPALIASVLFLGLATLVEQRRDRVQRGWSRLARHFTHQESA